MKRWKTWLLAAVTASLVTGNAVAQEAPDALVKRVAEDVLEALRTDKDLQSGDVKKAMDLVEAKILPNFDFEGMTADTVGKNNWRSASPQQRQRLIQEFKLLLVRTYATSLSSYKTYTIRFRPLRYDPAETSVRVRSEIIQPGGQPIQADYFMEKGDKGWMVTDVQFGGVSLSANYKTAFAQEIAAGGIEGLIEYLLARNKALEARRHKGGK